MSAEHAGNKNQSDRRAFTALPKQHAEPPTRVVRWRAGSSVRRVLSQWRATKRLARDSEGLADLSKRCLRQTQPISPSGQWIPFRHWGKSLLSTRQGRPREPFDVPDGGDTEAFSRVARQHSQLEEAESAQVIGPRQCLNSAHARLLGTAWLTDHLPNRAQRRGKRRTNAGPG